MSQTLIHTKSDLSIQLVSAQCISIICQRLISQKKEIKSKYITKDYDALIEMLNNVNEDTRFIPIENLLFLTKLSKENALYIPLHHLIFFHSILLFLNIFQVQYLQCFDIFLILP